ncbi:MAG: hypothetical protein ACYTEU_10845 [Planctomycetota bacterium]|jgi:hypothetical protein
MKKKTLQKIICDPYVIVSILIGIVLMSLTLYFRVNPAEGSVVDKAILGTLFHMVLLLTTMPAWIAGTTVAALTLWVLSYPMMFLFQVILYTGLGLVLRKIHNLIYRCVR